VGHAVTRASRPADRLGGTAPSRGKVAIITGAGSGIGWAAAGRFADEGARVVCADISGQERDIADLLGDVALPVRVDVTKSADVQHMVATAVERFGRSTFCSTMPDSADHTRP
jgi:NAD(P)-dependent dehydrogenase (short-subunit alcohol dehydrogenase family)